MPPFTPLTGPVTDSPDHVCTPVLFECVTGLQVLNSNGRPTAQHVLTREAYRDVVAGCLSSRCFYHYTGLSRPILKNLGILGFFKKPKNPEKLGF